MTTDVEKTEWSLPGPDEMPRDKLNLQLEVYDETLLLRGFEGESTWVRTVSADEIANVFTQHMGFSSGLLPRDALWWNQGETGQVVALWRPARRSGQWPLQREAFQAPRTAPAPDAGAGLRLLAGPRALGLRGPGATDRPPMTGSIGCPPSTSSGTGGSAPAATGSPRRWTRYRSPSSGPSSREPGTRGNARRSTPTTCTRFGRSWMEKTEYPVEDPCSPSARWPRPSRPPRGDGAIGYR